MKDLIGKCVCVLKIAHFKDKQGRAEIYYNSFTENYSITQIKSRQKSQKHLEEAAVPEHDFSYFRKAAASLSDTDSKCSIFCKVDQLIQIIPYSNFFMGTLTSIVFWEKHLF